VNVYLRATDDARLYYPKHKFWYFESIFGRDINHNTSRFECSIDGGLNFRTLANDGLIPIVLDSSKRRILTRNALDRIAVLFKWRTVEFMFLRRNVLLIWKLATFGVQMWHSRGSHHAGKWTKSDNPPRDVVNLWRICWIRYFGVVGNRRNLEMFFHCNRSWLELGGSNGRNGPIVTQRMGPLWWSERRSSLISEARRQYSILIFGWWWWSDEAMGWQSCRQWKSWGRRSDDQQSADLFNLEFAPHLHVNALIFWLFELFHLTNWISCPFVDVALNQFCK